MNTALMSQMNSPLDLMRDQLPQQFKRDGERYANTAAGLNDYNDLNALQSLKHKSGSDRDGALDAAAKHFESIFVSMLIKSMRDANKVFSEGNLLQSHQSDFYQQMFDSQMAVSLSTGKGIGLADVIKRQLSKDVGVPDANYESFALKQEQKSFSLEDYARQPFVSVEKVAQIEEAIEKIDASLDVSKQVEITNPAGDPSDQPEPDFSTLESFIASLYPYAKQVEQEYGIDARLMLAQSALETGWGQREILNADGSPSHNLFGIKAQADWRGDRTNITTTEYRGGIAMKERADFRSYSGYEQSFADYAKFLNGNARYEQALEKANAPHDFAKELQDAGYATDPKYADKINSIIDRYMSVDDLSALNFDSALSRIGG